MILKLNNFINFRFTFVFRGGDSTTVYYKVTSGLIKPLSPDETKIVKQKEEKKYELEQEIRRNTSILYELTKSPNSEEEIKTTENVNIDIDKSESVPSEKVEEIQQEVECTTEKIQDTKNTKSQDSQPTIKSIEIITEPIIKTQDKKM